jgi:hypothetical protein
LDRLHFLFFTFPHSLTSPITAWFLSLIPPQFCIFPPVLTNIFIYRAFHPLLFWAHFHHFVCAAPSGKHLVRPMLPFLPCILSLTHICCSSSGYTMTCSCTVCQHLHAILSHHDAATDLLHIQVRFSFFFHKFNSTDFLWGLWDWDQPSLWSGDCPPNQAMATTTMTAPTTTMMMATHAWL